MQCTGKCSAGQLKDGSCPHMGTHKEKNNCLTGQCNGNYTTCTPVLEKPEDHMELAIHEAVDMLKRNNV